MTSQMLIVSLPFGHASASSQCASLSFPSVQARSKSLVNAAPNAPEHGHLALTNISSEMIIQVRQAHSAACISPDSHLAPVLSQGPSSVGRDLECLTVCPIRSCSTRVLQLHGKLRMMTPLQLKQSRKLCFKAACTYQQDTKHAAHSCIYGGTSLVMVLQTLCG